MPRNIDVLTSVNESEICDAGAPKVVDITNGAEDVPLMEYHYAERSQGFIPPLLF